MSKLYKDISKMMKIIQIIEQFNNFKQLGGKEEIEFLKEKVNNLLKIKDTEELIKEFTWCSKIVNSYYDLIDSDFKRQMLKEEREKNQ